MQSILSIYSKMSFKHKLTIFSVILSISPVIIIGLLSSHLMARSMQEEVNSNHILALNQLQYQMNSLINSLNMTSIRLASNPTLEKSIRAGSSQENLNVTLEASTVIKKESSFSPIKFNFSLTYLKDNYVLSNTTDANKLTVFQVTEMVKLNKPLFNSSFMVMPDPSRGHADLLIFRPVPMTTQYTDGILTLHVNVNDLIKYVGKLSEGTTSKILIVDSSGKVVLSKDKNDIGTKLNMFTGRQDKLKAVPDMYTLDGVEYSLSYLNSTFVDWTYVMMTPMEGLTERSESIRNITWMLVAIISTVWVLFSILGSNRLYDPIKRLLQKSLTGVNQIPAHSDGLKLLDALIGNMTSTNRKLMDELNEQSPYLQQSIIQQILLGEMSETRIKEQIERFQLGLKGTRFYVVVVSVDNYPDFARKYKGNDRMLIHYAISKMIEELSGDVPMPTAVPQPGQVAVIIQTDIKDDAPDNSILQMMDELRLHIYNYLQFSVSIAVSSPRNGYTNIHASYQEAIDLLRCRLTLGSNVTISVNQINSKDKQTTQTIMELQKAIVGHVINGNLEEANLQLVQLIASLQGTIGSSEAIFSVFSYMLGELEYMLSRVGYQLNEMMSMDVYKELYTKPTIQDIKDWLMEYVFPEIKDHMSRLTVTKQMKIIQRVLQYISENYRSDLSLQGLADEFQISLSHMSRVFKEETNQTFSDYLLEFRMNKAKEWLVHTTMPIKEIARELSYANVTNFTRAFKQFFGTPPGKYRETPPLK
ncbi:helix-turn-helix domain-containing protein [Paenibacillus eucommiae]|uniref:AraC-like DNA-binding protein n=1 Tax=Paenibacillus eucommiae TaxID=1355755 RepID=A0ABS4IZS9_9BACL|nr:helix-turn-helix domain-containing protein [Paenibacillus eucommiae]MBP1993098.1 AraC-like DNA-binding protein [Paenibacillus eucommiae]